MAAIDRIEVRVVGPPMERVTWANLPPQFQTEIIVRIWDESGVEGVGATPAYSASGFDHSILETLRRLVPQLIGKDALVPEARWRQLQDYPFPLVPGALAVLDIALWDLNAKLVNRPLYKLLGGERERILAYASTPQLDTDTAYIEFVGQMRDIGYRAIKFHSWNVPEQDLRMLRAVHREYRDADILFMHDAEMKYDRRSALAVGKALEEMDFYWFEAPLQDFDVAGYCELRRRVTVPIVPQGCRILDLLGFASAAQAGAWDASRIDVALEGFTLGRMLSHVSHANGLGMEPQSWGYTLVQAANLHLGLAFEERSLFEQTVPTEPYEFGVTNPIRVGRDGWVAAPQGPGLGIDLDWKSIDGATITSFVEH
jgi:L-alanine-DL-glutamate epimerase-like enolase superfamily enzyme